MIRGPIWTGVALAVLLASAGCSFMFSGSVCDDDQDCLLGQCSELGFCVDGVGLDPGRPVEDAGAADAGIEDAGAEDAGVEDAGVEDAGVEDAGVLDAGREDAGVEDAGVFDAGDVDAGVLDAGVPDAGVDAGEFDAGPFVACRDLPDVVVEVHEGALVDVPLNCRADGMGSTTFSVEEESDGFWSRATFQTAGPGRTNHTIIGADGGGASFQIVIDLKVYPSDWELLGFDSRVKLEIPTRPPSPLANFPVGIKLSSDILEDPDDARFTQGGDLLAFEIVGPNFAWVRLKELSQNASDATVYFNSSDAARAREPRPEATLTWSSYLFVEHFDDTGLVNSHSGLAEGSWRPNAPTLSIGDFGMHVDMAPPNTRERAFPVGPLSDGLTVSLMMENGTESRWFAIGDQEGVVCNDSDPVLFASGTDADDGTFRFTATAKRDAQPPISTAELRASDSEVGNRTYQAIRLDTFFGPHRLSFMRNSNIIFSDAFQFAGFANPVCGVLGNRGDLGPAFTGVVDELRVSNIAQSDDWLRTERASLLTEFVESQAQEDAFE